MAEQTLPTMRYHPVEPPRLVETPEALAALGPEWIDHPYAAEDTLQWQAAQAAREDPAPEATDTPPPPHPRKR